jgi:hypothetical protein
MAASFMVACGERHVVWSDCGGDAVLDEMHLVVAVVEGLYGTRMNGKCLFQLVPFAIERGSRFA